MNGLNAVSEASAWGASEENATREHALMDEMHSLLSGREICYIVDKSPPDERLNYPSV